jgi:hypothetical protein
MEIMERMLRVPGGRFGANDSVLRNKRKEVAERLKKREPLQILPSGELVKPDDPKARGTTLQTPKGILGAAELVWYKKNPALLEEEKEAMSLYFPDFVLDKVDDGRLCWIGNLNPRGENGGVWNLMVVYDDNHPHNNSYGGSLRVYSLNPDLQELIQDVERLPHVLPDSVGDLYLCTAHKDDIYTGAGAATAATALGWATKWIYVVEEWLEGDGIIGDEVFDDIY